MPRIVDETNEAFFAKIIGLLKETADICHERIKEIPCITCPVKPQGAMFVMVIAETDTFILS